MRDGAWGVRPEPLGATKKGGAPRAELCLPSAAQVVSDIRSTGPLLLPVTMGPTEKQREALKITTLRKK